jgi:hypothetical protein
LLVVLFRLHRGGQLARLRYWKELSERFHLQLKQGPEPMELEVNGMYRGVMVHASLGGGTTGLPLVMNTRVIARLPHTGPSGLLILARRHARMGREGSAEVTTGVDLVDEAFVIRGEQAEQIKAVFGENVVTAALMLAGQRADFVRVTERCVELERRQVVGEGLEALIENAAVLASAISETADRPWRQMATRLGIFYNGAGPRGERVMQGVLSELRVVVSEGPSAAGAGPFVGRIHLSLGRLPGGIRVTQDRELAAKAGPNPTDEQIMASLGVEGTNADEIEAFTSVPGVIPRLVELFRKYPGSRIEGGRIQVERTAPLPPSTVDQVQELVLIGADLRTAAQVVRAALAELA